MKTKADELVEAILIIGAIRANPDLTHDTAKPLIEQHVESLAKRLESYARPTTIEGCGYDDDPYPTLSDGRTIDWQAYHEDKQAIERKSGQQKWKEERFIKPTDQQIVNAAILFNDGKIEEEKLQDMVALADWIIDRLYDNGNISEPSLKENQG